MGKKISQNESCRKDMIALTMIVSGEENPAVLQRCLNSIAPHVDAAYITITTPDENNLKTVAERYKAQVEVVPDKFFATATKSQIKWIKKFLGKKPQVTLGEKLFQFDKARNYNLDKVDKRYDWILWLDVDDVVRGADKLQLLAKKADQAKAQAVFMNYLYQVEMEGNQIKSIIIEHLRERMVKNEGLYKWVAPIHETLIEQAPTRKIETDEVDVVHLSTEERRVGALMRNIKTLELSVCETKGADPRPIYYLGKAYFDYSLHLNKPEYFPVAERLFKIYLEGSPDYENNNRSGWAEERAQCWEYLMEIYRKQEEHDKSIEAGMNALKEHEKFPSTYLNIALSYLLKGEFERAIFWTELSAKVPQPKTTLVHNPKDLIGRALEILYNAKIQTNKLDEAARAAKKLLEMYPDNLHMQERVKFTGELQTKRELTKHVLALTDYIIKNEDQSKLKPLLVSIPNIVRDNPFIADLTKKVNPPRTWEKDEIALFCGPGFTPWTPDTLEDPGKSFVGGSEEAVIYLTKELAKLGWKVTVYADPMDGEGEYDGVKFLPYYKFNADDKFNIFIGWRNPTIIDSGIQAKKLYIWCHDIQNPLHYTEERLKKITKVMVLSPWHRSNIPKVPDDKILITSNGVNL